MLLREPQRIAIAVGEEAVGGVVAAVDGAEAVDDVRIREVESGGNDGLAWLDRGVLSSGALELGAGGAVERAGDAAARAEVGVGGVDYGIDIGLGGDVAGGELERDVRDVEFGHVRCIS
jgi:hypothetical protein